MYKRKQQAVIKENKLYCRRTVKNRTTYRKTCIKYVVGDALNFLFGAVPEKEAITFHANITLEEGRRIDRPKSCGHNMNRNRMCSIIRKTRISLIWIYAPHAMIQFGCRDNLMANDLECEFGVPSSNSGWVRHIYWEWYEAIFLIRHL